MEEMQKQVNPTEKWIKKVAQKSCRSKKILSEKRVVTPETNRIGQPEGKLLRKEKVEELCRIEKLNLYSIRSRHQ